MAETVYYSDSTLRVTDQSIILPQRTYSLKDIKAVDTSSVGVKPPSIQNGGFWYIYVLLFTWRQLVNPVNLRFNVELREGFPVFDIGVVYLIAIILIALRTFFALYKRPSSDRQLVYLASVRGLFSKRIVAASLRRDHVEQVTDAIRQAIGGTQQSKSAAQEHPDVVPYQFDEDGQSKRGIWLDGKLYRADDIRLVSHESASLRPYGRRVGVIGDVVLLGTLIALVWSNLIAPGNDIISVLAVLAIIGSDLPLTIIGWLRGWRDIHLVQMTTAARTSYVFASIDQQHVQRVSDLLSAVLPYGGRSPFISDTVVEVNETVARFGKKTYPVNEIESVDVQVLRPRNRKQLLGGLALLAVGTALMGGGAIVVAGRGNYWLLAMGVSLLLPAMILLILSNQVIYTLMLEGNFGEVEAYSSHSELYVRKIATALRTVMLHRGEIAEAQEI